MSKITFGDFKFYILIAHILKTATVKQFKK